MRRQTGPVQQWIDSIPSPIKSSFSVKNEHREESTNKCNVSLATTEPKDIPYSIGKNQPLMTVSAPINVPNTTAVNTTGLPSSLPHKLVRDPSLQSDSSHCSSVESLLELRKADPEAILLGLGFGGCASSPQKNGSLSRIPKRFLQPSKLKGIAINDFMKQQQETSESFDSVSLGYRGLTGSPYVAPSEIVQKIMQRLREHESHEHDPYAMYNSYEQYSPVHCNGTLSVLSHDSRQFLERPRSKSPDMRNKRMIIGQKSFAFGHDGDLIEINSSNTNRSFEDAISNNYNIVEHSELPSNFPNNNDEIFEQTAIQDRDKILPKRLSFSDNTEFDENDVSSPKEACKENSDAQNKSLNEDIANSNAISENMYDIRRASDGFCNIKHEQDLSTLHERRHSDGVVQVTEHKNEAVLARRRKTLKRQTRVSDTDTTNCYDLNVSMPDTVQHKELRCNLNKDSQKTFKHKSHCTNSDRNSDEKTKLKSPQMLSTETHKCIETADDTLSKVKKEQDNSESCIEEAQSAEQTYIDEEETTTCCCHSGNKKYWKKMEKIIQKNKNLESMVTKNRREMAEIREMLNNVLSVRLEPGF